MGKTQQQKKNDIQLVHRMAGWDLARSFLLFPVVPHVVFSH